MGKKVLYRQNVYSGFIRLFLVCFFFLSMIVFPLLVQARAMETEAENQVNEQGIIRGVIVDDTGEALIGVAIREKGTLNGTVTDIDGRFSISVSSSDAILVFSYIGYETLELKISPKEMHIVMQVASEQLDEVVVVAYGTQKKVTMTGSVASIGTDEILKSPAPNLGAALSGKLPGLTTIQTSGEPGRDEVTMFLRGAATTNGTSPLILVDGVPRISIREIDSNEIASISILKDASATAVFGVRGANGVILITTRRGEKGSMKVDASAEYSVQSFAFEPERLNSWDYAVLRNEARANEGIAPEFSDEDIAKFESWKTGNPTDPFWFPNNNWRDILFKKYAPMARANVNISGGSDRLQYFMSAGYLFQGGMFNVEPKSTLGYDPQSKLNRFNFRSNIDYKFNKYVKASVNLSSYIEKVNGTNGSFDVLFSQALSARPTSPGPLTVTGYEVYNGIEYKDVRPGQVVLDPADPVRPAYGQLNRSGYKLETRSGANLVGILDFDLSFLTQGLSAKGQVSFDSRSISNTVANRDYVIYKYARNSSRKDPYFIYDGDDDSDTPISLGRSVASGWFMNMQLQLNYSRTFGDKHYVTGMVMAQRDIKEAREDESYQDKFLPFNVIGVSSRATYAYDSRYLFEFNIGYNGSEQFAPDKRFGVFPAGSIGWVISNESFLANNKYLTNLKLRASYGKVGNDSFGSYRFLYLDNISKTGSTFYNIAIPSLANGSKIAETYLGNNKITWETALKQNYGMDISVCKELSLSFDYFIEKRDNILIARGTVPVMQGLPLPALPLVNMGKVDNKGYELSLNYQKMFGEDYSFNLGGNFSYARNKVIYADEAILADDYAYRYRSTGFSIGQMWGYKIDYTRDPSTGRDGSGFFSSKENIEKSGLKYEIGTPLPGDFIYQDLNHDGCINEKDMAPIGYSSLVPRINYGFNIGGSIKGFDFSVMFQGVGQYSKFYEGAGVDETYGAKNYYNMHLGRWSEERCKSGEKITYPRLANSKSTSHTNNDFFIMDASYIRLKNAEIGYTLSSDICKKIGTSSIRFYVNGNNLVTWSHLKTKSFDPEQANARTYPTMRAYNFGVNVHF